MSYDRIIRAGLLQSERYLSLPTDTHRCAFFHLALSADDFGNVEGGARRLQHFVLHGLQVRNEADVIRVMSELADVDLVRRYEVDGKEFWHIPRFRNTRTYWKRHHPPSPWCDSTAYTGPYKGNPVVKKGKEPKINAKNEKSDSDLTQISFRPDSDLNPGVGVGVKGLGVDVDLVVDGSSVKKDSMAKTAVPFVAIKDLYNEKLPELPGVLEITPKRRRAMEKLWHGGILDTLEDWGAYFDRVRERDFLMGRVNPGKGHAKWRCDFNFLLDYETAIQIVEGKYRG